MDKNNNVAQGSPALERARVVVGIVLSVLLGLTAIAFVVSSVHLYTTGGDMPYSRESVNSYFANIAPLAFITLAAVIGAGIFSLIYHKVSEQKAPPMLRGIIERISRRLPEGRTSESFNAAKEKEKKHRRTLLFASLGISCVFAITALIFICNPDRYTIENVNTDIAYSVLIGGVAAIGILAALFVKSIFDERSYQRELEATRAELRRLAPTGELADEPSLPLGEGHAKLIVRLAVLAVGITFVILGIFNGGMADVLGKAVRICTECIGLG